MLSAYLVEAVRHVRSRSSAHHAHHCKLPSHPALFISSPTKNSMLVRENSKTISFMPAYGSKHLHVTTDTAWRKGRKVSPLSMSRLFTSSNADNEEPSKYNNINDGVDISIEYCSACRWMLRSSWIASELLTTFANESKLTSVTMVPQSPPLAEGGLFRVCASYQNAAGDDDAVAVLWDRKIEGRFPESKEVKQLVRDCVNPDTDLGHSDNKQKADNTVKVKEEDCIECKEAEQESLDKSNSQPSIKGGNPMQHQNPALDVPSIFYERNQVSIEFSTGTSIESQDNGLYRATYYAIELLSLVYDRNAWWKKAQQGDAMSGGNLNEETVPASVDGVTLIPNRVDSGILRVKLNDGKILYEQSTDTVGTTIMDGARLRDIVKDSILNGGRSDEDKVEIDTMDDDEAEEARKFFGVF